MNICQTIGNFVEKEFTVLSSDSSSYFLFSMPRKQISEGQVRRFIVVDVALMEIFNLNERTQAHNKRNTHPQSKQPHILVLAYVLVENKSVFGKWRYKVRNKLAR